MLEYSDLFAIERLKNAATNGRMLNVLMFALIIVVALEYDKAAIWLALAPVLSLGAAYLADGPGASARPVFSIASIACSIASFAIVFFL